jgi:pimeloyl-ACP methyl ester carboxylesterase
MSTLELKGVSLHYSEVGSGPPLVLVHGSAVDGSTWDGVVPALAADHRVITYDRRGYGRSEHKPVRDHRLHARDLIAVLDQVAKEPAHVVGWSSGGNISLAAATQRPELFRSLLIVEAPLHGQRHMDGAVLKTMLRLKGNQLRGRPVEALEEFLRFGSRLKSGGNTYDNAPDDAKVELRKYPRQVLAEWDPHPFGVLHEHLSLKAVAAIPVPITWFLGGEGSPWMVKLHDKVAARKPEMKTVVIPGAGHLAHIDQPAGFVTAVLHSIASTDAASTN